VAIGTLCAFTDQLLGARRWQGDMSSRPFLRPQLAVALDRLSAVDDLGGFSVNHQLHVAVGSVVRPVLRLAHGAVLEVAPPRPQGARQLYLEQPRAARSNLRSQEVAPALRF
jgi:hypothetical protein